jgi:uncharacterized membrane protein
VDASTVFVVLAIVVFGVLAAMVFLGGGQSRGLSPLAAVASAFVVAGIVFGDNRVVGYSLFGVGILVAVVDMVVKRRRGGS